MIYWRNFQKSSKDSIQFLLCMYHSGFHGNIGCIWYVFIQNLGVQLFYSPNLCVKFAMKFSISPKLTFRNAALGSGMQKALCWIWSCNKKHCKMSISVTQIQILYWGIIYLKTWNQGDMKTRRHEIKATWN